MRAGDTRDTGTVARLGFTFRLASGSGRLSLAERTFFGWLNVERLELDVPNLPRPIDLAAGPEIFQRHRTRVSIASLNVQQCDLDRFVVARANRLADLGVDQLHLRTCEGHIAGECRVREGPHVADLGFRVLVSSSSETGPGGLAVRLVITSSRIYGFLPTPASLISHRVLDTLLGAESTTKRGAPRRCGLGVFELDPLPLFLWSTLPPAGWRLPATRDVELIAARSTRSALQLSYGQLGEVSGTVAAPKAGNYTAGDKSWQEREPHQGAEERLRLGDIDGAIRIYRAELAAGGTEQTFVIERLLEIASSQPSYFIDAIELARQTLGRSPDFGPAHAALASIAVGEDDCKGAAGRYQTLARIANQTGDDDSAVHASRAGARLLRTVSPEVCTTMYEQVLALRPRDAEAAEALTERYTTECRWHELVRLFRGRLAVTPDSTRAAVDHTRLAAILAEQLGDRHTATAELERAVELDGTYAPAREALARNYEAMGSHTEALAAYDATAELYRDRGDHRNRAHALARSARAASALEDNHGAEARFHAALDLDPDHEDALGGAATLLETQGATEKAIAMWRRLIAVATQAPQQPQLATYSCELGRVLLATGSIEEAREALTPATTARDPELRARARALMAQTYEAACDREAAAQELAEAVASLIAAAEQSESDRAISLRHNAASLTLARAGHLRDAGREEDATESYQLAHSLAGPDDHEIANAAAAALLDHAASEGDRAEQLRWLEELLEHADTAHRAGLQTRLAEIQRARGEYAEALATIQEALTINDSCFDRAAALAIKAGLLQDTGDAQQRATTLAERATLLAGRADTSPTQLIEADVETAQAWLAIQDASGTDNADSALDAARRAVTRGDDTDNVTDIDLNRAIDAAHASLAEAAWRRRAWDDLVRGYQRLLDADGSPEMRARRWYRYGLGLSALDRQPAARDALRCAIELEDAPAQIRGDAARELADLHLRAHEPALAAAALELFAADPDAGPDNARADAWYRAGDLYGKLPETLPDAERCLEAALRLASDHMRALDTLERLKREEGDFQRVAVILGRKIAATARQPNRQKALLARLARVQYEELGRADAAREACLRALEIDPEFRPAVHFSALDSEARGELDRTVELYEQLSMAMDSDAELSQDHATLVDERYAALRALERLHRIRQDWSSLADTLARLSAATHARGDEQEAARLRDESRALSGEPARPAARTQVASPVHAPDPQSSSPAGSPDARSAATPAASDQQTALAAGGRSAALDTISADERIGRAIELEAAGQRHAAIRMYEAAALEDDQDPRPLEALSRLYEAGNDPEAVSEILGRLIHLSSEPRERAKLWCRRAKLYRDVMHREAETYRCLKEAYANDPDDGSIANALRSVAMVRGEWALAAELLYAEIADAADRREAAALHHELGLIFDEKLLDADQAVINYQHALGLDPEIPATPQPLARLYEFAARHQDAARTGEQAAERARTDADRGRLYKRAAANAERAELADDARRLYNLAASATDGDESRRAQDALARLSAAASDAFSSQELLQLRLAEETDARKRIDLLREMLETATEAGDEQAANRHAEQLFESNPNDTSSYQVLRERATAAQDWDALAVLQDMRASSTQDTDERAARFYALGRLYIDKLRDVNAAVVAFDQALSADSSHVAALEAVASIAYSKSDWKRARELYLRIAPEACSLPADALWLRRGEIAEAMGREHEALDAFRTAIDAAPSNRAALAAMARAAGRLGDHHQALEAMTALANRLPPDDIRALIETRLQLAELCQRLGEDDRALGYYLLVLAEEPDSQPALRAVIELHSARAEHKQAARALGTLAGLAATPGQQAELLYRRGEIFRTEIADLEQAADCYLKAIDLAPNHVPTLRRLIGHYWRIHDDQGLLELAADLQQERALAGTDPLPLARMLLAAGMLSDRAAAAALGAALATELIAALFEVLSEASDARPDQIEALATAAVAATAAVDGASVESLLVRADANDDGSVVAVALHAALH